MKIYSGKVITRLNHRPLMVDQEQLTDIISMPVILNGVQQMNGSREMTAGDVISSILTTKKIDQFNTLKAYALAQRFYMADVTDLDDSDFTGLRGLVEKNDQYIPLVLAQVIQVLIEAKEKGEMKKSTGRHQSRPPPATCTHKVGTRTPHGALTQNVRTGSPPPARLCLRHSVRAVSHRRYAQTYRIP